MKQKYFLFLLIVVFALGCETKAPEAQQRVLLPWADESGNYSLQEIEISGLNDPQVLSSDTVKVFYNSSIYMSGVSGEPARPNFTQPSDGLVVPLDIESSMAYSVFAHFSRLRDFDKKLGIFEINVWPLEVSISLNTEDTENNAFYVTLNVQKRYLEDCRT